jgi:hypothetical protein
MSAPTSSLVPVVSQAQMKVLPPAPFGEHGDRQRVPDAKGAKPASGRGQRHRISLNLYTNTEAE